MATSILFVLEFAFTFACLAFGRQAKVNRKLKYEQFKIIFENFLLSELCVLGA
ncbi:MAG: hypothetical protein LBP59_17405 [Planctomycetaceae bacterium]|nr:hypothetical protein [Planctomycetaceae bacterium]